MSTTITKTAAIKEARARVSSISPVGSGYYYQSWHAGCHAWYQHQPREYYSCLAARSQSLIDAACELLEIDAPQYDGGAWTDYI